MKKSMWLTGVAVLALSTTLAVAGSHGGRGGHRGKGEFSQKWAEKLNLTDAQKQQIRGLHQSFREENKAFFETLHQTKKDYRAAKGAGDTAKADSLKGQFDAQRAQMQQLHASLDQRIATVLTPEQRTQWEQLKAERAAKHEKWDKKQNQ
jgi:Spy/CpxP family protein refolding chaperone